MNRLIQDKRLTMRPKHLFVIAFSLMALFGIYLVFRTEPPANPTDINSIEFTASVASQIRIKEIESSVKNSQQVTNAQNEEDLIAVASKIAKINGTVLVTMVNDAYLSFTYSWLCNTKNMGIHNMVLIITTDQDSKNKLRRDWPEIKVVSMDMKGSAGNQEYSRAGYVKIMVKRTEMLLSILLADIDIFLFEVDCLWLANVTPVLQNKRGVDILVNPVAGTGNTVWAGGFLYLFPTVKAKALWKKLTEMMISLGERIEKMGDQHKISEGDNDQQYFSRLVNQRYSGITLSILSLDDYADGKWYEKSKEERAKTHPLVINNNWVLGNKAKVDRAKKEQHWFIKEDWTCDMDLVEKIVYH